MGTGDYHWPMDTIDVTTERYLQAVSASLTRPRGRECLLCYLHRMMREFRCDGRLSFARRFRDALAPRATGLEDRLGRRGGYCDCEVLLNAYEPREDLMRHTWDTCEDCVPELGEWCEIHEDTAWDVDWPDPMPACAGVRLGSTQACRVWQVRRRRWRGGFAW